MSLPPYLQEETIQERSKKQEKKSAKDYGGRRIGGSGSGRTKGDINVNTFTSIMKGFKGELKYTDKQSYPLKLQELQKIEREAFSEDKYPFFEVEIQGVTWVGFRKTEAEMFMRMFREFNTQE